MHSIRISRLALSMALALAACGQNDTSAPTPTGATATPEAKPTPAAAPADEPSAAAFAAKFTDGERSFAAARAALLAGYYDESVTEDDLYRAAVEGMLARLDPKLEKYNRLLSPRELGDIRADLKGEVVGVGVQIEFDDKTGYSDVLGTIPGSPAEKAGIGAGDKVLSVNGKLFKGQALRDVVREIRGKAGEPVHLTILRGDRTLPFDLVRAVVHYDAAAAMLLPGGTGYLLLHDFSSKSPEATRKAIEDLAKQSPKALVVDLRGNHGGSFEDAIAVAELLLPKGTGIVSTMKRGKKEEQIVSKGPGLLADVPTAVLVNGATSSGGEFVAAALQEGRKAKLVGARTFGKWSVQKIDDLSNGYALKYTVSLFRTPSGRSFEGQGLAPDVEVALDEKECGKAQALTDPAKRQDHDPQLRTAVGILRHN